MKKILIVSSNRLGDSILTSGVINYYKEKFKKSNITLICGPVPASLFKYYGEIDRLIITNKKKFSMHWIKVWIKTFSNFWDFVVDFRGTALSLFLISKKRINHVNKKNSHSVHMIDQISETMGEKRLSPKISINENLLKQKKNLKVLREKKKKKKLVMIAPTANWIGKIWPIKRYAELIRKLSIKFNSDKPLFIIVAPSYEEHFTRTLFDLKNIDLFDLVGKTNLAEIFLIMKECSLFVGNDSGLMHLAAASGVPTVGLFGPSNNIKYKPYGKKTMAISSQKSPEELMGGKDFNPKSCDSLMMDLTVEKVSSKIESFFKKNIK